MGATRGLSRTSWLSLVVACIVPAAALAASEPGPVPRRFHDPVILQTTAVAGLVASQLRLYGAQRGALAPIPFQFDGRDADGELELTGEPATLDDNDELVFMAKDAGPRLVDPVLPKGASHVVEIEIAAPDTGERSWAYLVHFPSNPPPPSSTRYVSYDPESREVATAFYRVRYAEGRDYFTAMEIGEAAGGNGRNVLRRTRVRAKPTFSLLLGSWSPEFTEDGTISEVDGVRTGPVRVIRRLRHRIDLGRAFPDLPGGTTYTIHYATSFVTPTTFSVPPLVLKLMRDFEFEQFSDFQPEVVGMTVWDAEHPTGRPFTGHSGNGTSDAPTADHEWWAAGGEAGTLLQAFLIPDQWKEWGITRGTMFVDGATPAQTAADGDRVFAAGYALRGMSHVREPGDYSLLQATFVIPHGFQAGDQQGPMAMLKAPLQARVASGSDAGSVIASRSQVGVEG